MAQDTTGGSQLRDPNDPPGDECCDKCMRSGIQVARTDPKNGDTICVLCDHENPDEWGFEDDENDHEGDSCLIVGEDGSGKLVLDGEEVWSTPPT